MVREIVSSADKGAKMSNREAIGKQTNGRLRAVRSRARRNSGRKAAYAIQGRRSSLQMAAPGAYNSGSSIEQVLTSIDSESSSSSINIRVPKQRAKARSLSACLIRFRSPDKRAKFSLRTDTQATMGAHRRQESLEYAGRAKPG